MIWLGGEAATDAPPSAGDLARAIVHAPFATDADGQFRALWLPAEVAVNGWDPGDDAPISRVAIVEAQLIRVGGPRAFASREGVEIEARVHSVHSILDSLSDPGIPTDLSRCELNPRRPYEKLVAMDNQLLLVETDVEGDIVFSFVLVRGQPSVLMVMDECICAGFFYAGHGIVSPRAVAALMEPSVGNGAERLHALRLEMTGG